MTANSSGVLVVTGGSRGIGAATALLAAEQGYAVVVNYAGNAEAAGQVTAAIHAKGGDPCQGRRGRRRARQRCR